MKIRNILAAVDLGYDTEQVLAYASFFARGTGASLNFVFVVDYLVTPPTYLSPYIEEEKKTALEGLRSWEKRLEGYGVAATSEVMIGRLVESIETAIRRTEADMLVLGFRPHTFRRSSSERLIKGLKTPMLVVRGTRMESKGVGCVTLRKILCPTDFSDTALKALKVSKELSDLFSAELDVIHVVPSHIIAGKARKGAEEARSELIHDAKVMLDTLLKESGIGKEGLTEEGEPYGKIIAYSSENAADLIVIGARGLSFIQGMLIGSVTDAVLKSSPCPVLVVH